MRNALRRSRGLVRFDRAEVSVRRCCRSVMWVVRVHLLRSGSEVPAWFRTVAPK